MKKFSDVLSGILLLLFYGSAVIGASEFIEKLFHLSNAGSFIYFIVAIVFALTLYYVTKTSLDEIQKKLDREKYKSTQYESAIGTAVDLDNASPLFSICDTPDLHSDRLDSYFWYRARVDDVLRRQKKLVPFSSDLIGKTDPYNNAIIQTEDDYAKYLLSFSEDAVSTYNPKNRFK